MPKRDWESSDDEHELGSEADNDGSGRRDWESGSDTGSDPDLAPAGDLGIDGFGFDYDASNSGESEDDGENAYLALLFYRSSSLCW